MSRIRHPTSLYVHIPFCRTLCTYCAFNTYAGLDHLIDPYVNALCREMALVGAVNPASVARTLYFGGGTPSLMTPWQVERVINAARRYLGLRPDAEITLEANPGSLDLSILRGYRDAGIGRLSLGVQSAQPADLHLFGRRHTFAGARASFDLARQAGFDDISLDLIYGAMGQTLEGWQHTLESVLSWSPDHFSLYSLILEPGTSLYKRVKQGSLPSPNDDLAADMYEHTLDRLSAAGYEHYEISTWGKPGHHSRHNRTYWRNEPFLGFGAGAHGAIYQPDDRMTRYWCVDPVPQYIDAIRRAGLTNWAFSPALDGYEVIDRALEMSETAILNLRLVEEGIDKAAFQARFSTSVDAVFGNVLADLTGLGMVEDDGQKVRLTRRGYLLSNQVFMRLLPEEAL
jgi:oxygen-independent coproporphyrinogen-3 oxidase